MHKITPFIWCVDNAKEVAEYYTTIFSNTKITARRSGLLLE